jgi:2-oxoglutarate ferredoxin oxidoreductase subunit delta
VSFCPKQVVRLGGGLNQLGYHTAEVVLGDAAKGCNACARCALMCPDAAITVYR